MAMGAFAAEYLVIVQWTHLLLGRNANNPGPTNTQYYWYLLFTFLRNFLADFMQHAVFSMTIYVPVSQ